MDKDASPPVITIKANIDGTIKEIREALTDTQAQIFKKTCFGQWLDISLTRNNQLLIHTVLTCMVDSVANELSFVISGKPIHFRRQEFCLVTGLRFGSNMYIKEWVKNIAESTFRKRVFPNVETKKSVKLLDAIAIFDKMRDKSLVLEDNDAVKICLLVLLQQGFLGHQMTHKISNEMLMLVEDLSNCWNIFPWGSYIWDHTYPKLRDALSKRQLSHDDKRGKGEEIRYTLTGFVYAFMIWILEAIPATHVYVTKAPMEKIPRAFGWKMILPFTWARCRTMFAGDKLAPPLETLTPTKAESETDWWKASMEYFEGKHDQGEHLEMEKDSLIDQVQKKKRKICSSPPLSPNPTYDQLMLKVSTLEGTMKTTEPLKDTIPTHLDVVDAGIDVAKDTNLNVADAIPMTSTKANDDLDTVQDTTQKTRHTEEELEFIRMEKSHKPNYDLPDLRKIKRNKYPIYSTFEKKKTDCYLDCLPKGRICETSFWDTLYPGGEKVDYQEQGKLDGLHINAYIELLMRKRPHDAQWTLGLSELVAFHTDSGKLMSMVSVVDAVRATIDGTNPMYPAWDKISQVFFPINLDNEHWVAASWNLDNYQLNVYDSLECLERVDSPTNYNKIRALLKQWKDFMRKDLENMHWFENTKRDPECFKISLRYMKEMPKQSFKYGTLDCGVMTCKFIEMLTKGKTIDVATFGDNVAEKCQDFRAKMALMLYETRCEKPL